MVYLGYNPLTTLLSKILTSIWDIPVVVLLWMCVDVYFPSGAEATIRRPDWT